jgi:hypothetical protein
MKQVFRLALGDVGPAKRGQATLCGSEAEPVRDLGYHVQLEEVAA